AQARITSDVALSRQGVGAVTGGASALIARMQSLGADAGDAAGIAPSGRAGPSAAAAVLATAAGDPATQRDSQAHPVGNHPEAKPARAPTERAVELRLGTGHPSSAQHRPPKPESAPVASRPAPVGPEPIDAVSPAASSDDDLPNLPSPERLDDSEP